MKDGRFDQALVPIHHDDGSLALSHEEFPRPGTTLEDLAGLNPSFEKMGAHKPEGAARTIDETCLLYTSPSPRDRTRSRMPSSA